LPTKRSTPSSEVPELLAAAGKSAVIPPKANRTSPREYDQHLYNARHLIENFFAKLKQFRAIAACYDETARNFLAAFTSPPALCGSIDDTP
jgi:transposase